MAKQWFLGLSAILGFVCACGGAQEQATQPNTGTPTQAEGSTGTSTTTTAAGSTGSADTSVSSPKPGTPPPCQAKQVMGADKCFDTADDACASIGCPRAQCSTLETAPAKATCKK